MKNKKIKNNRYGKKNKQIKSKIQELGMTESQYNLQMDRNLV